MEILGLRKERDGLLERNREQGGQNASQNLVTLMSSTVSMEASGTDMKSLVKNAEHSSRIERASERVVTSPVDILRISQ